MFVEEQQDLRARLAESTAAQGAAAAEMEALLTPQLLDGNVQWFRGGLVFEAHRLLYHSA